MVQFCLGNSKPLLHTAGIAFDFLIRHLLQINHRKQPLGPGLRGVLIQSFYSRHIEHKFAGGKIGIETKMLRHIA